MPNQVSQHSLLCIHVFPGCRVVHDVYDDDMSYKHDHGKHSQKHSHLVAGKIVEKVRSLATNDFNEVKGIDSVLPWER